MMPWRGGPVPREPPSSPRLMAAAQTPYDGSDHVSPLADDTGGAPSPCLVAVERARLLTGTIDPLLLLASPGEATRLTVYCEQGDRVNPRPPQARCLSRGGMSGMAASGVRATRAKDTGNPMAAMRAPMPGPTTEAAMNCPVF